MKKLILIVLIMLFSQTLQAFEPGLLNLKSPMNMEDTKGNIKIQHRFYGDVSEDTFGSFFGADSGANVGLNLDYILWSKLELSVSRIRNRSEIILGTGYSYFIPAISIQGQVDVQFFRYDEFNFESNDIEKKNGILGLISLQSRPILKRISPAINIGYDSQEKELGAGIGAAVTLFEFLSTIQKVMVIGEYFPTTIGSENDRSYAFGVRIETYGHDFDFVLGNNSELGTRHLMSGTTKGSNLRFGFNIKRRI